jgi:signal transduction histidine kinase
VTVAVLAGVLGGTLTALAYDPFHDLRCALLRTCRAAPRPLGGSAAELALSAGTAAGLLAVGAALVAVVRAQAAMAVRVTAAAAISVSGVVLATGRRPFAVGGHNLPTDLLLAVAVTMLALAVGAEYFRTLRTRHRVDRLIAQLETDQHPGAVLHGATLMPAQRLALDNALLMTASRTALTEIRGLQRRTQERADDERERIERDLHDGAQQQLVSAAIQLGLAASTGPEPARAPIEVARREVLEALAALREVGHGMFPQVLVAEGLEPALRELCADNGVSLQVAASFADCPDTQIRRAGYAVVAALLAAEGDAVRLVRLRSSSDGIEVRVDDARGSVPGHVLDRVVSVGGDVAVGQDGTKVVIPCGS